MSEIIQKTGKFTLDQIPEPENIEEVIYSLMVNPNLSAINYFNNFSELGISPEKIGDDGDEEAGLVEVGDNGTQIAMSTHALHHHLEDDPQKATEILIARAVRKMLCFGAEPIAVSAFLYHIDFADPKGYEIVSGAQKGLENAASVFGLKISDRKIRFDHFASHGPVHPTIIISIMARVDEPNKVITHSFKHKGNHIFVIGKMVDDVNSSEYLEFYHSIGDSDLPAFNIQEERKIQDSLRVLQQRGLIESASPIGKGGLFFTLLRAAIPNDLGFDITTSAEVRIDSFLFGEAMGRILAGVHPDKEEAFVDALTELGVPFFTLGHVTKGEIRIDDKSYGYIDKMTVNS